MNDLLELKGKFESGSYSGSVNEQLPANKVISLEILKSLYSDLIRLKEYWNKQTIIPGVLISVYYNRVIPKSSRIKGFLSKTSENSNNYVKGVRFSSTAEKKHIITYYIEKETLNTCIRRLEILMDIIVNEFNGLMNSENMTDLMKMKKVINKSGISKTMLKRYYIDLVDIEKFDIYQNNDVIENKNSYITLFDTDLPLDDILNKIGISNTEYEIFSKDTIYLSDVVNIEKIRSHAPYLISMAMMDFATYYTETENKLDASIDFQNTPKPTTEPVIGVIDTLFDNSVYFNDWVEYYDCLNPNIPRESIDYMHGTTVSSIIIDGARSNPKWDDECGMFRVRHFGVAKQGVNNSFDIINKIREIVSKNPDIHVWNISLGSKLEISDNYISPEAAALDEIQYENNVVFVIAGTNSNENPDIIKIGAPADSINSLVINAVDKNRLSASYSRKGKVLSFFVKPDVCAFGGDDNEYINCCGPFGAELVRGTSYAAPWISRKMCYLIDKMGLSREIAKALIINSAVSWNEKNENEDYMGYGVVPTKISDVIMGEKDEIKFYLEGNADSYYTYTYNLPIPMIDDKFPFNAKAVLCYYPKCSRSQGVDYTNTELDLHFGRMWEKDIKSINRNTQGGEDEKATTEATARKLFRKWDNVKVVVDAPKSRKVYKGSKNSNLWGVKITNKERLEQDRGIKFGVVITLKEMDGKNRLREFVDMCTMRNWIVNRINIDNRLDVYAKAEEIIEFE